jgi:hypothetical protein
MNRTNGRPNQPMIPKQSNTETGRKLLLNDIDKMYPGITRESVKIVADSFQHRDIDTSNIKKTVTTVQGGARQVYAASVEENQEIPSYLVVEAYQKGHYMPLGTTTNPNSNAESQYIIDQHKAGTYNPESKVKSASNKQVEKITDHAWIVTNNNIAERNIYRFAQQEKEKEIAKKTAHIKQATSDVPAWVTIANHYSKGSD